MKIQRLSRRLAAALLVAAMPLFARADNVLRIVPQSNLVVLDPVWTSALVTRNHAYMIYDTLFGIDASGQVKPEMVDKWQASADQTVWTFTLRDGLKFSDGSPVTSADVVASVMRWSERDTMGVELRGFLSKMEAVDAKTFRMVFRQPFGLVREALGRAGGPAFIMPKRIADTPASEQIKESIGSGPYLLKADEFKPGQRIVYVKNPTYVPRAEEPSGTAGGKRVYVDRVEWVVIRDPQTQLSALKAGEVDVIEQPASDQYATLGSMPDIALVSLTPAGAIYTLRFNFLAPPFDRLLVRRAAMLALGQDQVLRTQVGTPSLYKVCKSFYPCGTEFESKDTGLFTGVANPVEARKLLDQAGYKGEPVVLMRPTDFAALSKAPLVVKQELEQAGFKVDLQSMDWQTLVLRRARKDAPAQGGWNAFITYNPAIENQNPLTMVMLNATGARGWFGWQDDPELEALKKQFAMAASNADRRALAQKIALRAIDQVSHVNLGQFFQPAAARKTVTGFVPSGAQVYWNVRKAG